MRSVLAVVASIAMFVATWSLAVIVLWLVTKTWPQSVFGETADAIFKKAIIWVVAPGAGAYYAMKLTKKWFEDVRGSTIFVGFLGVFTTLMIVLFCFNLLTLLSGNPNGKDWLEAAGFVAQCCAAIYGATIAKNEFPAGGSS